MRFGVCHSAHLSSCYCTIGLISLPRSPFVADFSNRVCKNQTHVPIHFSIRQDKEITMELQHSLSYQITYLRQWAVQTRSFFVRLLYTARSRKSLPCRRMLLNSRSELNLNNRWPIFASGSFAGACTSYTTKTFIAILTICSIHWNEMYFHHFDSGLSCWNSFHIHINEVCTSMY